MTGGTDLVDDMDFMDGTDTDKIFLRGCVHSVHSVHFVHCMSWLSACTTDFLPTVSEHTGGSDIAHRID